MGGVSFPILTDFHPHGKIAQAYGIFNDVNGAFRRAVIVIDKNGIVRFKKTYTTAVDLKVADILAEVEKLPK